MSADEKTDHDDTKNHFNISVTLTHARENRTELLTSLETVLYFSLNVKCHILRVTTTQLLYLFVGYKEKLIQYVNKDGTPALRSSY